MKKILLCCGLALFCTTQIIATTITWTGNGTTTNWSDANNWDLQRRPLSSDDVVIPPGVEEILFDRSFSQIESLEIGLKSNLWILKNKHLYVSKSDQTGVEIDAIAKLINEGRLTVNLSGARAMVIEGELLNRGDILIQHPNSIGIVVDDNGLLTNEANGQIDFKDIGASCMAMQGILENKGTIDFQSGNGGMALEGEWHNHKCSLFRIRKGVIGYTFIAGELINEGEWNIVAGLYLLPAIVVNTGGHLINENVGSIYLDLTNLELIGINVRTDSRLTNYGLIDIVGDGKTTNQQGIALYGGVFDNESQGRIILNAMNGGILSNSIDAFFNNHGSCEINNMLFASMVINSEFYNDGNLEVDHTMIISSLGNFINEGGTCRFDTKGSIAITLFGIFENNRCGRVWVSDRINSSLSGIFFNRAFLEIASFSPLMNGTGITNDGVVHDPGDKVINLDNNSLHLTRVDEPLNPPCGFIFTDAFDVGNNVSVDLPFYLYPTPDLVQGDYEAIYFEQSNEVYILNEYPNYFAAFTDQEWGCSETYSIPVEHCPPNLQAETASTLATNPLAASTKSKVSISPNPANDHLQIQAPFNSTETINFRLVDALGRLMWNTEIPSGVTTIIDLPSTLSGGWYIAHFYEAGRLLSSEKVLVQKDGIINH